MKYAVSIQVMIEASSKEEAVEFAENALLGVNAKWQFQEMNTVVEAE